MQRITEHHNSRQNPDDVRFTKAAINLNFPDQPQYGNIYNVLNALENKRLVPRDLPSLRVVWYEGRIWTLDNKLLYIYRISPKVKRISVVYISGQKVLDQFLDDNSKSAIQRMSSAEFFPELVNDDEVHVAFAPVECVRPPRVVSCDKMEMEKITKRRSTISSSVRSASSSIIVTSRISSKETTESEVTSDSPFLKSKPVRNNDAWSASSTNSSRVSSEGGALDVRNCRPHGRYLTSKFHRAEDSSKVLCPILLDEKDSPLSLKFAMRVTCQETLVTSSLYSQKSFITARKAKLEKISGSLGRKEAFSPKSSNTDRMSSARTDQESPVSSCYNSAHRPSACQEAKSRDDAGEILEAFVFPDFCYRRPRPSENTSGDQAEEAIGGDAILEGCYPVQKTNADVGEDGEDFSNRQKPNTTRISSEDGLDRPVSSCSSYTERPRHRAVPPNAGLERFGRMSRSPPRASVSAGGLLKCQLSADHESEVSKKILLRHMKKAFFSVC